MAAPAVKALLAAHAAAAAGGDTPPEYGVSYTDWWLSELVLTDGAAISSAAANHDDLGLGALTATGTTRPLFQDSGFAPNSTAYADFDGSNDLLTSSSISAITHPLTLVFVVRAKTITNNEFFHGQGTPTNTVDNTLQRRTAPDYRLRGATSNVTGGTGDTNAHLIVCKFHASGLGELVVDGTTVAGGGAGDDVGGTSLDALQIGGFTGNAMDSEWGYAAVLAGLIDSTDEAALESFVADYYGITIS